MFAEVINALFVTYLATEYGNLTTAADATTYNNYRKKKKKMFYDNGSDGTVTATAASNGTSRSLHRSNGSCNEPHQQEPRRTTRLRIGTMTALVVLWNIMESSSSWWMIWMTRIMPSSHAFFDITSTVFVTVLSSFQLHPMVTKIVLVILLYILTLYVDCWYTIRRQKQQQQQQIFHQAATIGNPTTTQYSPTDNCEIHPRNQQQHTPSHQCVFRFWHDFIPRVLRLFIRILPIYPIMAILISVGFLVIISAFELFHVATNILNRPIYYGTLYGPFSYIYYHVKRDILIEITSRTSAISTLPRHTSNMKVESSVC
jgi:Ca2+/Na+ antiporter